MDFIKKIPVWLLVITLICMAVILFRQSVILTEQRHLISILEVKLEDIDESLEEDVVPRLESLKEE